MSIPYNVIGCGPIVLPIRPLSEQDPELNMWLQRKPTILINLGTLYALSSADACRIARALRQVLNGDGRSEVQVLWKLQKHPDDQHDVFSDAIGTLETFVKDGRVKVVSWLKAEPLALLETGSIICSVHHGGANTWFEAIK